MLTQLLCILCGLLRRASWEIVPNINFLGGGGEAFGFFISGTKAFWSRHGSQQVLILKHVSETISCHAN